MHILSELPQNAEIKYSATTMKLRALQQRAVNNIIIAATFSFFLLTDVTVFILRTIVDPNPWLILIALGAVACTVMAASAVVDLVRNVLDFIELSTRFVNHDRNL